MNYILRLLVLSFSVTVFAQELPLNPVLMADSGGMGNGGHPSEIEFQVMGREIVQTLDGVSRTNPGLAEINLYDLSVDIEVATVEIKTEVIRGLGGKEVCAASYPGAKYIQLNLKCWNQLKKNDAVAKSFVLKTYLDLDQAFSGKSSMYASLFFQALKTNK